MSQNKKTPARKDGEAEGLKRQEAMLRQKARPKGSVLKILRRLISYFERDKWIMFTGIFLSAISSMAGLITNALNRPIFNYLADGVGGDPVVRLIILVAVIALAGVGLTYLGDYLTLIASQRTISRLRMDLFEKMQELPLRYFDQRSHGDIMSLYTNDVQNVADALEQTLSSLVLNVLIFIGTFSAMLWLSPRLTLITVAFIVLLLIIVRVVSRFSGYYFRERQTALGLMNGFIEERIEGQKVVKVFTHESENIADFTKLNEELRVTGSRAETLAILMMPISGNMSSILYAAVAVAGALFALAGSLDIGAVVSYLLYTRRISQPISQLANQLNLLIAAFAGAERIFELIDSPAELDEGKVRLVFDQGKGFWEYEEDGETKRKRVTGDIRFNNVDFSYNEGEPVLKDINFYAKPGQSVALVGSTGAGKTTVTNLLTRFYELEDGEILYDGFDIRDIDKDSLRRSQALVLQDVHLFKGTIRENIRFGKLSATDTEIEEAARLAGADTFIRSLEDGYEFMLDQDGQNLSQGQRQLISIARAAVARPPVLVLDEATSSIDTRTEFYIQLGMDRLMQNATTIVIAHRLSTVRSSNVILVIEEGEIVERGTHDELMAMEGRYYDLNTGRAELV